MHCITKRSTYFIHGARTTLNPALENAGKGVTNYTRLAEETRVETAQNTSIVCLVTDKALHTKTKYSLTGVTVHIPSHFFHGPFLM